MFIIYWFIEQLWTTLNVIAFTAPLVALGIGFNTQRFSKFVRWFAALTTLGAIYGGLYALYRGIGFPAWMRWIDRLVP